MIKLSVIIPAYNACEYIERCLKSIFNQNLAHFDYEVIVVDDGSDDNTLQILDELSRNHTNFIVLSQKNAGPGMARNLGLKYATGKYIGFVDSDDEITSDMYSKMIEVAETYGSDIVSCNYRIMKDCLLLHEKGYSVSMDETIDIKIDGFEKFVNNHILNYKFGSEVWSKLFKREHIVNNNIRFEDHKQIMGEDLLFLLELLVNSNKVSYINKSLYIHNIRNESIAHSLIEKREEKLFLLLDTFSDYCDRNDKNDYTNKGIPLLAYNFITTIIANTEGFNNKKRILLNIEHNVIFKKAMSSLSHKNDVSIIKRSFCFLCDNNMYSVAILFRIFIDTALKIKGRRS